MNASTRENSKTQFDKIRADQVSARLPDALDLLAIYISAGHELDEALRYSSQSLEKVNSEVAFEFYQLADDMRNQGYSSAFDNFRQRCDSSFVRDFVQVAKRLVQEGAPLSNTFRVLALKLRLEGTLAPN